MRAVARPRSAAVALAGLLLALAPWAGFARPSPGSVPVGDGSAHGIPVSNLSVHEAPAVIRVAGAPDAGVAQPLAPYEDALPVVQCMDGDARARPRLEVAVGERRPVRVDVPEVGFPDGPPVVWIAASGSGSSHLRALVRSARGASRLAVRWIPPAEAPRTFAALRFAPLVIVSADALAALSPPARQALRDVAAAGGTVLVPVGEGATADGLGPTLAALDPRLGALRPGAPQPPGPAIARALPRALSVRALPVPPGASGIGAAVEADGAPILLEVPVGLGWVRVLGVDLAVLRSGVLADAALGPAEDTLGGVLSWLERRAPPEPDAQILGAAPWLWLLALACVLAGGRWFGRPAWAVAAAVWGVGFAVSPVRSPTEVTYAEALYLPLSETEALAVGIFDVRMRTGGGRALPTSERAALEAVRGAGACLATTASGSAWLLEGAPGGGARLSWFAVTSAAPSGSASGETGTLRLGGVDALIRPVDGAAAPLPLSQRPGTIVAHRVDGAERTPRPPIVLAGATDAPE